MVQFQSNIPTIDMDRFFEAMLHYQLDPTKKIMREFPGFEKEIEKYRRLLAEQRNEYHLAGYIETYRRIIHLGKFGHYEVGWKVPLVEELINRYQPPLHYCFVNQLIGIVDKENINYDHIRRTPANAENPIYLAQYPPLDVPSIIIDGNHRVVRKYEENPRQPIILLSLPPEIHLQAMAGDLFRLLYKIHYNLQIMIFYIYGDIDSFCYTEQEGPDTLYPL